MTTRQPISEEEAARRLALAYCILIEAGRKKRAADALQTGEPHAPTAGDGHPEDSHQAHNTPLTAEGQAVTP
jgi:hypothetical protein